MVVFLACETGGSKYLQNESTDVQTAILQHNTRIYDVRHWAV